MAENKAGRTSDQDDERVGHTPPPGGQVTYDDSGAIINGGPGRPIWKVWNGALWTVVPKSAPRRK